MAVPKTVVVTRPGNVARLKRCLMSLARELMAGGGHVILASDHDEDRKELDRFSSVFTWECFGPYPWDLPPDFVVERAGEQFFLVSGEVLVWKGALQALASAPAADVVAGSVYRFHPKLYAVTDDYGANVHEAMVEFCKEDPVSTPLVFGSLCLLSRLTPRGVVLLREQERPDCVMVEEAVGLLQDVGETRPPNAVGDDFFSVEKSTCPPPYPAP